MGLVMCGRCDDPTQHDVRCYDVTYYVSVSVIQTRKVRVWAMTTDEARQKARQIDPEFIATARTPRIVR